MSLGTRLKVGKTSVRTPRFMSEAGYVQAVNAGMKSIQKDLDYIIRQFEDVTPEFMLEALRPIFEESQRIVPERTGDLKASGYLEITEYRGNPTVEVGYAKGGNPDYAVFVHEMVEIPHKPPTQAKYLEKPVNEGMGDIIDRLAAQYKDFMGPNG